MKRVLMGTIAAMLLTGGITAAIAAPASADTVQTTGASPVSVSPDNRDM
ncbi:hypothetical protein FHR33_009854 [Nonomuraea dietziae]|uniref:Secreted protein n=1 Tax=Nonomuraea dietziae TaxID=65515 RepID=A0A7W5VFE5_9ACTN|nr:hypothetical protein [Nonomuraea dietziae]